MKTAQTLFTLLGIKSYTVRHLKIVQDFIDADKTDAKELLSSLGEYTEEDLKNTELFLQLKKL